VEDQQAHKGVRAIVMAMYIAAAAIKLGLYRTKIISQNGLLLYTNNISVVAIVCSD